jgi:hypothetical protein
VFGYNVVEYRHVDRRTGKIGKDSAAAKFASATPSDELTISEEKPYAEVCFHLNSKFTYKGLTKHCSAMDGNAPFSPFEGLANRPLTA